MIFLWFPQNTIVLLHVYKQEVNNTKTYVVLDYNLGEISIDLSDQMSSYSNPLRRSQKWYKKVSLDAPLYISVVNSIVGSKLRSKLVEQLIKK